MENKLHLGVGREIITPKIGGVLYGYPSQPISTGVHDNLTATAYAFSYGDKKLLYINLTLCTIRSDIFAELREAIENQFGIPRENVVIGCTHTHSGPSLDGDSDQWGGLDTTYYEEIFRPALFSAVAQAYQNVEPVTVATAFGDSKIGINRRMQEEGTNRMWLGECPWGVLNTKLTILSFKTEAGAIKGNLFCYGAHGTSAGACTLITRDWSGYAVDALEEKTGGITAFVLGPEGDIAPRKHLPGKANLEQLEASGAFAAQEVLRIFADLSEYKDVSLDVKQSNIKVSILPRPSKEAICARMAELKSLEKMRLMQQKEYNHLEVVLKSYDEGYVEREYDEFEQVVFRIGDVAFATFAFELFCEIGLRIEYNVKDLHVVNTVCTNGKMGYFPNQSQISLGGYEVDAFKTRNIQTYADDADYSAIVSTVANLNSLER